jgi:Cof subfamily protein (haloacid dehalogenase superfamily)
MQEKSKGWLALDIDGTITNKVYEVPQEVVSYLKEKEMEGWKIAIATGRTFHFAKMALSQFSFPFILIPQNGASALSMPEEKILFQRNLPFEIVPLLEQFFKQAKLDFIIYLGSSQNDRCYYRPKRLSPETIERLNKWQVIQKETWHPVDEYTKDQFTEFAAAKAYGKTEDIQVLKKKLQGAQNFHVTVVKDPVMNGWSILFVTHPLASKGGALKEVFSRLGRGEKVIGAGDDENDLSLLDVADVKIAMEGAPPELLAKADLIATQIVKTLEIAVSYGK